MRCMWGVHVQQVSSHHSSNMMQKCGTMQLYSDVSKRVAAAMLVAIFLGEPQLEEVSVFQPMRTHTVV